MNKVHSVRYHVIDGSKPWYHVIDGSKNPKQSQSLTTYQASDESRPLIHVVGMVGIGRFVEIGHHSAQKTCEQGS